MDSTTADRFDDLADPLRRWLEPRIGAGAVTLSGMARPAGGQSNDTVMFRADAAGVSIDLVLRRQAEGTTIFQRPDVLREARVIEGLARSGVAVPHVRWTEADPSVLGAPFFVMDRVEGRVPLGKPSIHSVGWLSGLNETDVRRLWESALDTLVAVHAADWRTTHAFLVDSEPADVLAGNVDELVSWYRWSTGDRQYPVTDAAAAYLTGEAPKVDAGPPVLLWGDARVGNMLFADDLQVSAALDWETATIGPAARDVAHWLFFDRFQTTAVGISPLPGWPDREHTIERYEAASGRRLPDLRFFDILAAMFIATTLIRQSDARVARGLAPADTRMGHDNTVTQILADLLDLPAPGISPDYLAHRGIDPRKDMS